MGDMSYDPIVSERPPLTVEALKTAARAYAQDLSKTAIPDLYGVDNGKRVGTFVEAAFRERVHAQFASAQGSAAHGIDFPGIAVDLKVTSIRQPQSSCPFRDATQKVYGLGYHLLVLVYEKSDDHAARVARLDIQHVLFIAATVAADHQTTAGIHAILEREGNVDDLDAFFQERNLPLDDIGRRALAQRCLAEPPPRGVLTISNALQWRLQYSRAIESAVARLDHGVEDLLVA